MLTWVTQFSPLFNVYQAFKAAEALHLSYADLAINISVVEVARFTIVDIGGAISEAHTAYEGLLQLGVFMS